MSIQVPSSVFKLPHDYNGYVFISDIDKTYLSTEIDSIGGLLKAAFETAERKANVPGFSTILRAVRRGAQLASQRNPVYFVSASPPQLAQKLFQKMQIDGVEIDGIIFKDQLEIVKKANFKKLTEQIGYKLSAFLELYLALPPQSKLVFFGDDSEADPIIYSLFVDIVSKHVYGPKLIELLKYLKVDSKDAVHIAWRARQIKEARAPVVAAFVNLVTGSRANFYTKWGPFLYPTENSLQIALSLFELGLIREQAVKTVSKKLVFEYDLEPLELADSIQEAAQRGLFTLEAADKLWPALHELGTLPAPPERNVNEGAVARLSISKWTLERPAETFKELRKRYSEEGRY